MKKYDPYIEDLCDIVRRHMERCRRAKEESGGYLYPTDPYHPYKTWKEWP